MSKLSSDSGNKSQSSGKESERDGTADGSHVDQQSDYYYDDATGYEVYDETKEDCEEDEDGE